MVEGTLLQRSDSCANWSNEVEDAKEVEEVKEKPA